MVDAFRQTESHPLVDELDRVVGELEKIALTRSGEPIGRLPNPPDG